VVASGFLSTLGYYGGQHVYKTVFVKLRQNVDFDTRFPIITIIFDIELVI
jgi:hypothetical protein